jgi:hypothetical protein
MSENKDKLFANISKLGSEIVREEFFHQLLESSPSDTNLELFCKNYTNLVNFIHTNRNNTKDTQNFLNINQLEMLLSKLNADSKALHLDLLVYE